VVGTLLGMTEPDDFFGKEEYDVAVWARRIRIVERTIPGLLVLFGVNAQGLATNLSGTYPSLAGAIAGGLYPSLTELDGEKTIATGFASWEILAAKALYWYIVPAMQFGLAIFFVDTWQYFLHRYMHMNKWLYNTFHSRHHRLYVPYAFGALYNHPFEGFLLDTLGASLAFKAAGMSTRQGMWFFTCSTIKTVDDHCGYKFPWDPLQYITENNAAYHDVHHQSWGIKTNFSQPFSTFWDRILDTAWTGGDVSSRYERDRILAQKKVDADETSMASSVTNCPAVDPAKAVRQAAASQRMVLEDKEDGGRRVIEEERREEQEVKQTLPRNARRRTSGFDPKALSDRVTGSLHGRTTGILHADGGH